MSRRKLEVASPRSIDLATPREGEREDRLRYISEMTGELAAMAGAARMPMLTYFLNMARVEAEMQLHRTPAGGL
ncbi:MAG TPA: hypothetical protein PKA55_16285 [Rhodoblastus sp.]|nr:hypothetical protein [Rhodoblastus sp.]